MAHLRMIAAAGCLTLGVGDLAFLDFAVLPAVLAPREAVPEEARAVDRVVAAAPVPVPAEVAAVAAEVAAAPAEVPAAPAEVPAEPAEVAAAPARSARRGDLPRSRRLRFALDDSTLSEDSRAVLDDVAARMVANPALVAHLDGHADPLGAEDHNELLSQARAEAAVAYLVDRGIVRERLVAQAFGERRALAGVDRSRNRRVEIRYSATLAGETSP
jgi:outer membrane protein OmpA-like peptidoglycan-associated protein